MKVVVHYTVEVDEPVLRGIRRLKNEKGVAQGKEVKAYLEAEGKKSLSRVRWTREQEQAEREARRAEVEREKQAKRDARAERRAAVEREKQERREAKEREKQQEAEQLRRTREADWIYFLDNGYASHTICGWCGQNKPCRGKRRAAMACHECYVDNGAPTAAAKKAKRAAAAV